MRHRSGAAGRIRQCRSTKGPGNTEPENETVEPAAKSSWADKVERREAVALDARQVDRMVASLGHCVTAVYAVSDAVEADGHALFKRERLVQANKSIEEAAALLDTLPAELTA